MVYAGFRDARRDIQDPPLASSDPCAAPDPNDEEHMDARPHQEEIKKAINNFLLLLDKQEKKGFKDLATILSQLPKPAHPVCGRHYLGRFFSQRWIKIKPIGSLRWSFACTCMLRTTG